MIDSMAILVPCSHTRSIFNGGLQKFDADGVVQWTKESWQPLEGSFDARTMVKTELITGRQLSDYNREKQTGEAGRYTHIRIEGSPAKFLQGHNLFGTENIHALVYQWVATVLHELVGDDAGSGIDVAGCLRNVAAGDVKIHRVDVARMADFESEQRVADFLGALSTQAHFVAKGRGVSYGHTSMWGNRKTRTTVVKAYNKFRECTLIHPLPEEIPHREWLKNYARNSVRFEVEFHSKFLDAKGLRHLSAWHADTCEVIYEDAMTKLNITGQRVLTPSFAETLPRALQRTYYKWQSGMDVRATFRTKQSFYQHRSALLRHGIDIALPHSPERRPVVVSLAEVIRPTPKPVPQWAYGTVLLAAA